MRAYLIHCLLTVITALLPQFPIQLDGEGQQARNEPVAKTAELPLIHTNDVDGFSTPLGYRADEAEEPSAGDIVDDLQDELAKMTLLCLQTSIDVTDFHRDLPGEVGIENVLLDAEAIIELMRREPREGDRLDTARADIDSVMTPDSLLSVMRSPKYSFPLSVFKLSQTEDPENPLFSEWQFYPELNDVRESTYRVNEHPLRDDFPNDRLGYPTGVWMATSPDFPVFGGIETCAGGEILYTWPGDQSRTEGIFYWRYLYQGEYVGLEELNGEWVHKVEWIVYSIVSADEVLFSKMTCWFKTSPVLIVGFRLERHNVKLKEDGSISHSGHVMHSRYKYLKIVSE